MNFLLKIVEGPNKGAEIALVEGVAVTFGKGDDCDVVLADSTLPEEPLSVEASADGVTVDGRPAEPFEVMTSGATSFAVGPADAPWGALKWPKSEEEETGKEGAGNSEHGTGSEEGSPTRDAGPATEEKPDSSDEAPAKKGRGGCLSCFWFSPVSAGSSGTRSGNPIGSSSSRRSARAGIQGFQANPGMPRFPARSRPPSPTSPRDTVFRLMSRTTCRA